MLDLVMQNNGTQVGNKCSPCEAAYITLLLFKSPVARYQNYFLELSLPDGNCLATKASWRYFA